MGVSLASGSGIITKQDEVECVLSEIRCAAGKVQGGLYDPGLEEFNASPEQDLSLSDFELGGFLAKGCNAAVVAARWKDQARSDVRNEGEFPLAIKMMFNYEAESNAFSIINAMHKEIVPARNLGSLRELASSANVISLERHPFIIDIPAVFADRVPQIDGALSFFPHALPARLNPEGLGRNMSLFLVMKRYDSNLKDFLSDNQPLSSKTSLVILTQLLEAVTFLAGSGVAHRDLKADNILMDVSGSPAFPCAVLSDFGCCLADSTLTNLRLPFPTRHVDRGGNAALMAPEISRAQPGVFASLDFSKSDVWSVGALAYEIFGAKNPFYPPEPLHSAGFSWPGDLPALPGDVPPAVASLICQLLDPNPRQRPSAELAATICQLMLWAPQSWWSRPGRSLPSSQDVLQWLLTVTTKVMCEAKFGDGGTARQEYRLLSTFLSRLRLATVKEALKWLKSFA